MDTERFGLADSFNYFSGPAFQQPEVSRIPAPIFTLPPVRDPSTFVQEMSRSDGPEKKLVEFAKGTTTLAFKFKEGVLVAVDSRASMGDFESSNTVFKVIEMNDFMIGTMAGGAADCQYWEAILTKEARVFELKHGQRMTISAASKLMQNIIYQYRGYGLSIGCMIAGVDKNGTHLYYVDNEANRIIGKAFSVGSGSPYAYGVMDTYNQDDLTLQQAIEIGKRAIYNATYHDSGSGGVCRSNFLMRNLAKLKRDFDWGIVYHVHKDGWTRIEYGVDVDKLHYHYAGQKGKPHFRWKLIVLFGE